MEQQTIPIQEHKLKIIEIIDEAPDTKTFRVGVPEETEINFFPGQFFIVRFEDNPAVQRAYSIASSPSQKNYMDITIGLVGEFTHKLWETKIGNFLLFEGPYGKFYFNETMNNNLVLIGGGLGITPLTSIIRYCNDKKLQNKINFIYSVKTPEHIVYHDELKKIKEQNPNFKYTVTITRPSEEQEWDGRTGRIDIGLLKQNIENTENSLFYLCGPLEFVKVKIAMLENLGAKKEQIKTDIWGG
jgi:ferredoxin-NADP reductase